VIGKTLYQIKDSDAFDLQTRKWAEQAIQNVEDKNKNAMMIIACLVAVIGVTTIVTYVWSGNSLIGENVIAFLKISIFTTAVLGLPAAISYYLFTKWQLYFAETHKLTEKDVNLINFNLFNR